MASDLTGQVGLITGCGSKIGIGRSAVLLFAKANAAAIYGADLDTANMESLKQAVKEANPKTQFIGVKLDVASHDDTKSLLQRILREQGRFDFFYANAGFTGYRDLYETTEALFAKSLQVMTVAPYLAVQLGSRAMQVTSAAKPVSKGSVIITASLAAWAGKFAEISYTVAKTACVGVVNAGAYGCASSGVRVNAVAPGATATSLNETSKYAEENTSQKSGASTWTGLPPEIAASMTAAAVAGADAPYYAVACQPEEIAQVALFLASDASSAITGQTILADHGLHNSVPNGAKLSKATPLEF